MSLSKAAACVHSHRDSEYAFERHQPEETLLYRTLLSHWRRFLSELDSGDGSHLPRFIEAEVEAYLRCGILAHGFVRVRCEDCTGHHLVAFSCKRRGFCPSCIGRRMADTAGQLVDFVFPALPIRQWVLTVPHTLRYQMAFDPALTRRVLDLFVRAVSAWLRRRARAVGIGGVLKTGAVTVIQRFDSALGLNVHFHTLFIDGVYARLGAGPVTFHRVPAPSDDDVADVAERVFRRVVRDLSAPDEDEDATARDQPALLAIAQASLRQRIATGVRRGQGVRRMGWARGDGSRRRRLGQRCAEVEGFNLHANVRIAANDRKGLEALCRYLGRPPLSEDRLRETGDGNVTLRLKRAWSDGTTHLVLSPHELIEKLIPLVPRPRAHLTRYHGVLAPASGWRRHVVPRVHDYPEDAEAKQEVAVRAAAPVVRRRHWTPWAELLKRVFLLDVLVCRRCGGRMRIVATVMARESVQAILAHGNLPTGPPTPEPSVGGSGPLVATEEFGAKPDSFADSSAPGDF